MTAKLKLKVSIAIRIDNKTITKTEAHYLIPSHLYDEYIKSFNEIKFNGEYVKQVLSKFDNITVSIILSNPPKWIT